MNILIRNLSNTYNYGSMMMGENLITYLLKHTNMKINFYIDNSSTDNIKRLKKATEYNNIYIDKSLGYKLFFKKIPFARKIEMNVKKRLLIKPKIKKYDYIIILGGDDYSETYYDVKKEGKYILSVLDDLSTFNKITNLYMIGQTIGPYTGPRLKKAQKVFKEIKLFVRDKKNYNYVKNELGGNPIQSSDLAFLDLKKQSNYQTCEKYKLQNNKYITFVGTSLMSCYSTNPNDVILKVSKILTNIQKKFNDKKIVWLSHVVNCHSQDAKMLKQLNKINPKLFSKMLIIDDILMPYEARNILGNAYLNLSFRMHATVSSFQMGKPCICISYSPKYSGVIGEGLDIKELIIEGKNDELWSDNNDEMLKIIDEKLDYIINNYSKIVNKIKLKVKENQKTVEDTIIYISKEMRNKDDKCKCNSSNI